MEKEILIQETLTECQEDFSTNARTDILGKYSRFHGKTEFSVWCNSPDVKYIDSFRDIIFEISPHHITCVYKKMFETAALSNLLILDGVTCEDVESADNSSPPCQRIMPNSENEFVSYFQEHVDKSNSCIYSTSFGVKTLATSKGLPKLLGADLNGWEICERPHLQGTAGYQIPVTTQAQEASKRHGKHPNCRTILPSRKSFPAMMRLTRHNRHDNTYRSGCRSSSPRVPSRENSASSNNSDGSVSHSNSTGSIGSNKLVPIKIGHRFRHFRRNSSYMEQYREEYTYQRLNESRDYSQFPYFDTFACFCASSTFSPNTIPKCCDQRLCPSRSHCDKSRALSACEKNPCITSGVPVPKRTPVLKSRPPPPPKMKQPYVAQIPKLGDAPKSPKFTARENIPKLEFFATSFTVNNYNPVKTPPSPAHKSASNSASSPIMNCGRVTKSPVHVSTSLLHLLNQNLKGLE